MQRSPTTSIVTRPGSRTGGRHGSLDRALSWSFDRLPPETLGVLTRLAVYRGGFVRDVLETAQQHRLDDLVASSLVRFAGDRYFMLEPVRQFAIRRADEAAVLAAHQAHTDWAVRFAERAGRRLMSDGARWPARIDAERDNLDAAVRWSLDRSGDRRAARLVAALGWAWSLQGGPLDVPTVTEAVAQTVGDEALRQRTLRGASPIARTSLARATAGAWTSEAVDLCRRSGSGRALGWALFEMGMCDALNGLEGVEAMHDHFTEALELFRTAGDDFAAGWTLNNLGFNRLIAQKPAEAVPFFEEVLSVCTDLPHVRACAVRDLGRIAYERGHRAAGLRGMRQAIDVYRGLGDRWQLGNALTVLIYTVGLDEPDLALEPCRELLGVAETGSMADHEAPTLPGLFRAVGACLDAVAAARSAIPEPNV